MKENIFQLRYYMKLKFTLAKENSYLKNKWKSLVYFVK